MKKLIIAGLIVGVVGLVFTSMAGATSMKGRLGLRLYGGQSWINPSDYNDMMELGKAWFESEDADTELQKFENTTLFGGDLRYGLTDNLVLAAGYISESGKGMLKGTVVENNPGTKSFTIEDQGQMTGYTLGFNYTVIDPPGLNLYLVGGAGSYILRVHSTGKGDWDPGWPGWGPWDWTEDSDSIIGYHGGLGLQWFFSPQVALDLEALYRSLIFEDFAGLDFDMSGLIGILSLTLYL